MEFVKEKHIVKHQYTILETLFYVHSGIIGATYMIFLLSQGLSLFSANLVSAIFSIATLVLEVPSGVLCDCIGKKRTALLAGVSLSIAMALFLFGKGIFYMVIAQVFWGIGYALESGTVEAWAVNKGNYSGKELEKIFSFQGKIQSVAMIGGSFIGAFFADLSLNMIWTVPLGTSLVFIVCVLFFMNNEANEYENIKSIGILYKSFVIKINQGFYILLNDKCIRSIYLMSVTLSFVSAPMFCFWSVYLDNISNSNSPIYMGLSIVWVLFQVAIYIGNHILEKISSIVSRKKCLIITISLFIISVLLLNISTLYWGVVTSVCLQELFFAILTTTHKSMVNDYISNDIRATMISFSSLYYSLGRIISTLIFGFVADQFSIIISWNIAVIFGLFFVASVVYFYKKG